MIRRAARPATRIVLPVMLAAMAACTPVPGPAPGHPRGTVSPSDPLTAVIAGHVEALSTDAFAGRGPGTPGETMTLDYLQREWEAAGLEGGTGDPDSPWRAAFVARRGETAVPTNNLVGLIRGTDPDAGAVLLLAHYDHLGVCRDRGADRICNGAVDNATGIAIITEVARALAAGAPMARDVYVLATGAEELGLLGAKAFVESSPVPIEEFVAAFNIDTEGLAPDASQVVVIGEEGSRLDPLIGAIAREQGVALADPAEARAEFLRRQDGWALIAAGVPAVMISAAFADEDRLQAFLDGDYHGPGDEFDKVELGAAPAVVRLHSALVRAAADPQRLSPPPRAAPAIRLP